MTNEVRTEPAESPGTAGRRSRTMGSCELEARDAQPGKGSLSFGSKRDGERREGPRGQM